MKQKTKAAHTPGPWQYHEGVDYIHVYWNGEHDDSSSPVATAVTTEDARLIAAAPTMKDALIRIRKALNANPKAAEDALRDDPQAWDALNAAIAKAQEGR